MLEIGKTYKDGHGKKQVTGGPVKDHPQWVWAWSGNWYEKTTGRFVWFDKKTAQHELRAESGRDIDMKQGAVA